MESLSFRKSPGLVIQYFGYCIYDWIVETNLWILAHRHIFGTIIIFLLTIIYLNYQDGDHQEVFYFIRSSAVWYSWWTLLGIASSVGLGTGLHTFVLFLGPHIAHVTITAYKCKSLMFDTRGEHAFLCANNYVDGNSVTIGKIFSKIWPEAFFWGFGTALGELPPYFVARAAALAGQESEALGEIDVILKKKVSERSFTEKTYIFMFHLMRSLGFFGILIAASIPNPLFDLAGIICGRFSIPFLTFFGATFIGKAFFKSSIQSLVVILSFSKEVLSRLIDQCDRIAPFLGKIIKDFLMEQAQSFIKESKRDNTPESPGINWISYAWNAILITMIGYFLLSTVESLANAKYKKSKLILRKSSKSKKEPHKQIQKAQYQRGTIDVIPPRRSSRVKSKTK